MRFYEGTKLLRAQAAVDGVASFTTTKLAVGTHTISATFQPAGSKVRSALLPVTQQVNPATTNIALTASKNPSRLGQTVRIEAKVTRDGPAVGIVKTGSVALYDGGVLLGAVPVHGGDVTFATKMLSLGAHDLTATYSGSLTDLASTTSHALTQQVN
jgi:hypothetical protein